MGYYRQRILCFRKPSYLYFGDNGRPRTKYNTGQLDSRKVQRGLKMEVSKVLILLEKYAVCPSCGNACLGGTQGTLVIGNGRFIRTCKCGFKTEVETSSMKKQEG